ncbi:Protein of unknown function [Pyronema omphalodes CBS 100304]|uniref:Uncharacterized protein n=1 Tax=Pyronema omphalodes (strain CBS 100304) TaxID=1076935 RepID=U4LSX7_PYROM|nr:Protein of unknown function [Pyronema omphalodes CBS 100304]
MQLFPTRRFATLGIDQCKPRLLDRFGVADGLSEKAAFHMVPERQARRCPFGPFAATLIPTAQ